MAVIYKFLNLIRVLFPKWSFFDHVGYQFRIEYKTAESPDWIPIQFTSQRTRFSLFLNPLHNLTLAQVSVIEHFARDVQNIEPQQVQGLDSFKLLKSILETKILLFHSSINQFQFRLMAFDKNSNIKLFHSPWVKVNS